jgi:hypothetical protein
VRVGTDKDRNVPGDSERPTTSGGTAGSANKVEQTRTRGRGRRPEVEDRHMAGTRWKEPVTILS